MKYVDQKEMPKGIETANYTFDVNNKIRNLSVFFSDELLDDIGTSNFIRSPATSG